MDMREGSEGYHAVVAVLNDDWRVIDSCERYPYRQWILQKRRTHNDLGNAWRGSAYCQTRSCLESNVRERAGDITEEAKSILGQLPHRDLGQKTPELDQTTSIPAATPASSPDGAALA
jgi:hypothetical protein